MGQGGYPTLLLTRWLDADDLPSVWRLAIADGRLTRIATIPAECTPRGITLPGQAR